MRNKLMLIFVAIVSAASLCEAQSHVPYRYPQAGSAYAHPEHLYSEDVYRERIRAQIARERAAIIHAEEAARRDRMYSRGYGSDVDRNEQRNTLETISQATRDIAQIAGTVKFIQGLFGN